MKILLIYFLLFTFYVDEVLGAVGLSNLVRGLSLFNLNIYMFLIAWGISIALSRRVLESNNLNLVLILMAFLVVFSIPFKVFLDEIPRVSIVREVLIFKSWINPFLLFFIIFNIIKDKRTCDLALMGLGFLLLALILTQLSAIFGFSAYKAELVAHRGRVGGFGAPGVYAVALVLFFPLILSSSFLMEQATLLRVGCIALAFLSLLGLISTGSRNGLLSFICSMAVYIMILRRENIIRLLPIIVLSVVLIVASATALIISPSSIRQDLGERLDPTATQDMYAYSAGRTELWKNALKLFIDSPLLGHGQDSYVILSQRRQFSVVAAPHNEYLRYLVDYGIVGLLVFCMIFYKIFQNAWRSVKITPDPWMKKLFISYIAGLCGFTVGIFFTNIGSAMDLFFIYTAVIYKYSQLEMKKVGGSQKAGVSTALS